MVMFTNTSRVTGLSGINTEDMVRQIMRAESQRLHRLQRRNTLLSWQQEAYRSTSSNISDFQSNFLSMTGANSIRVGSNMRSLVSTSSNRAVAATATGDARAGTHRVRVNQLASRDRHTSGTIGASIKAREELDHTKLREGDSFRISLNGGAARQISFTQEELDGVNSNEDFVNLLNQRLAQEFGTIGASGEQRVEATLDSQGRLNIDTNGMGNRVTITEGTGKPSTITGNMSQEDWAALGGTTQTMTVNGRNVTVDFSRFNDPDNPMTQAQAISTINEALRAGEINNVTVSANANGEVTFRATGTNEDIAIGGSLFEEITGNSSGTLPRTNTLGALGGINNNASNTLDNNHSLRDIFGQEHFNENGEMTFTINGRSITLKETYSVQQMQNAITRSGAGVTLTHNSTNQTITLEANNEGESNRIDFGGDDRLAQMLGLQHVEGTGTNALVEFNGVALERESNNFTVEGIRLELNEVTQNEVTIEVRNNSERTREIISNFVEEYNKLIEELNELRTTGRPRARGGGFFEPLTDEQRREMSETEIREWEERAKTGMLHRSEILNSLVTDMRRQLNEPITLEDGTVMRLSDFGITTSPNFRDNGKLVIDEERLTQSLENFSDQEVAGFFGGLGNNLNETVNNATRRIRERAGQERGLNSTNNILQRSINNYESRISRMETQLTRREAALFAKFARMEAAVMQSNSQMDQLFAMMQM